MPPVLRDYLPLLRRLAVLIATVLLALLLLWSVGLIICQPVCALPMLPVAGLIYWHWKLKGKLSLRKWLWVYVIAQVAIFLCLPGPQNVSWKPMGAKAPRFYSEYGNLRIDNIRDFRHHSAEEFDIRYREERFRIKDIIGAYYAESRPAADSGECRPMLGFELRNGHSLVVAPEVRYPTQGCNPLKAWYKSYGLLYVFGTEEDIFLRSTDILKEELCVFPLRLTPQQAQRLFRSCMALSRRSVSSNEVYHPLWDRYASGMARVLHTICPGIPQMIPFDSVHLARALYDAGKLQPQEGETFAALRRRSTVGNNLVTPGQRDAYSNEWRRRIGAPLRRTAPADDEEEEEEEEEDTPRSRGTGIIFSGNRFREDIPEPGDRGGVPYYRSDAAGRAASIPEPGARLQADALPSDKKKKNRKR